MTQKPPTRIASHGRYFAPRAIAPVKKENYQERAATPSPTRVTGLAILLSALATQAMGQATRADRDFSEAVLEEVEVRASLLRMHGLGLSDSNGAGSRLGQSMADMPASVELIDSDAIALKGDFFGLSAVTRATGIAASASPGNGGTAVSSRGFNGHGSVVNLYDGTRLYVGAGTVSFPADTWTVSRIEVLRGPGSVINGVGATGATINWDAKEALSLSGGVRYVGERYVDDANQRVMPAYSVWDAVLQWRASDRLELSLRGLNLGDSDDFVLAPYGNQWILGEDRTFQANVNYRF